MILCDLIEPLVTQPVLINVFKTNFAKFSREFIIESLKILQSFYFGAFEFKVVQLNFINLSEP